MALPSGAMGLSAVRVVFPNHTHFYFFLRYGSVIF